MYVQSVCFFGRLSHWKPFLGRSRWSETNREIRSIWEMAAVTFELFTRSYRSDQPALCISPFCARGLDTSVTTLESSVLGCVISSYLLNCSDSSLARHSRPPNFGLPLFSIFIRTSPQFPLITIFLVKYALWLPSFTISDHQNPCSGRKS